MAEKRKSSDDVKKEELDDITTCCICTEAYTDPKALPCIHTFCLKCIQETGLNTNKGPGDEMPCPICRRLFKIPAEGFNELPRNFFIERLIQVSKISNRPTISRALCSACLDKSEEQQAKNTPEAYRNCVECKRSLCEECCIEHAKNKLTRNHKVIPIAEYKGEKNVTPTDLTPIICELHRQRVLDVYCADCESVVCAICFIEDHKNHDGSHVDKYVDGFKEEIEMNAYAINQFRSTAQTKQAAILKMKEDIRVKVANLECDIASRADELKQLIDKHATTLLQGLRSMQQSNLKEMQLATDDIDAYLSCLETYNSYCQKIIAEGSASDTCRAFSYLSIRAGELYLQFQDLSKTEVQSVNFCFRKSKLEEFLVGSCDNLIGEIEGKSLSLEAKLKQELSANEQRMMLLEQKKQRLLAELRSISDPVLVHTIRPNPGKKQKWFRTEEESNYIIGLAIIDKELFVLCEASPEVEVYDSMKFNICRRWHLRELAGSTDIASCNISKCLYTLEDSLGILRVDPNGKLINKWSTGSRVGCEARLSVTGEANVLLIDSTEHKLSEYSPDGTLIQEINLLSHAGIRHPLHAIKLTNSHFIISHDNYGDLHRVCTVDADGKLKKSFGGKPGSTIGQMHFPIDFSVDGNASVLVLDHGNKRVLLLDSDLEVKREIVTKGHRLQQPWKILLDESNVKNGAKVVFCARDAANGQKLESEVNAKGPGESYFVPCDVTKEEDIKNLIDTTVKKYGRIDCLINNAGYHPPHKPIDDFSADDFRDLLNLNVVSYFLASKYALPHLRKTEGNIINDSSLVGMIGQVGAVTYCATKGAISAMTRALAVDEASHNVRVNAFSPGNVWTPMWEAGTKGFANPKGMIEAGKDAQLLGRFGTIEECGELCLYLAAEATFLTGVDIPISGGAELNYGMKNRRKSKSNVYD